jgi:hypothetical protein
MQGVNRTLGSPNIARRLYEQIGFERQGEAGDSVTMLLTLDHM